MAPLCVPAQRGLKLLDLGGDELPERHVVRPTGQDVQVPVDDCAAFRDLGMPAREGAKLAADLFDLGFHGTAPSGRGRRGAFTHLRRVPLWALAAGLWEQSDQARRRRFRVAALRLQICSRNAGLRAQIKPTFLTVEPKLLPGDRQPHRHSAGTRRQIDSIREFRR
jgi:hypothetical protein